MHSDGARYLCFHPCLLLTSPAFGVLDYCTWPQPPARQAKIHFQYKWSSVTVLLHLQLLSVRHLQIVEVRLEVPKVRQDLSAERREAAALRRGGKPQVDAGVGGAAL